MREKTELKFVWDNLANGTGTFRKISHGREYERKVTRDSYLNPVEVSKVLDISLVHVHRLIKNRLLKAYLREKGVLIKMDDILKFNETKRSVGRPRAA